MNGSFLDTLRTTAQGRALDELTEEQQALIDEVRANQSEGELLLTVKYTPRSLNQVRVSYEVKTKRPKRPREESLFFMDENNVLTRDDPRQGRLDIDPDVPRRESTTDTPPQVISE